MRATDARTPNSSRITGLRNRVGGLIGTAVCPPVTMPPRMQRQERAAMPSDGGQGARGRLQIGLMMRSGNHPVPGAGRVVPWSELKEIALAAEEVGVDT